MRCDDVLNGWIVVALSIFTLGIGVHVYMQTELNKVWQSDEMESAHDLEAARQLDAATTHDDLDRIEKLARLHSSGALTTDEYAAEKAKVLAAPEVLTRGQS